MKRKITALLLIIAVGISIAFAPKLYNDIKIKSMLNEHKEVTANCETKYEQQLALVEYWAQMPFDELLANINFLLDNDFEIEGFMYHGISLALIREEIGAERFREEINNENNHPDLIWLLTEIDDSPEVWLRDYRFLSDAVNNPQ